MNKRLPIRQAIAQPGSDLRRQPIVCQNDL